MDKPDVIQFLFVSVVFYIIPFLIAVILPARLIPLLNKSKITGKAKNFPSLLPFTLMLILLAIVANLFWENQIFNKVYYEWDRTILPYTFFSHEFPVLDNSLSWIAPGWQLWHLDLIWIGITLGIYYISAIFWLICNRKHWREHLNFISISVAILTFTSVVFWFVLPFISLSLFSFFRYAIWK